MYRSTDRTIISCRDSIIVDRLLRVQQRCIQWRKASWNPANFGAHTGCLWQTANRPLKRGKYRFHEFREGAVKKSSETEVSRMLRRSLMNFHFRLIHTQSQLCARGGRGRTETISSSYDERLPNESDRDQAQPSIRKPRTEGVSAVDEALERKAASKRANLLDEAVTDYLKVETAETQEPWSSPTYPPEVIPNPRTRQSNLSRRPNIDPRDTSIFLFPGQGSQYVGMAKDLVQYPNVAAMFHCASEVLRYDLLKLCMEGPEEKLNRTVYCQPAIFVTSLACVEKVKVKKPVVSYCEEILSPPRITRFFFLGCP